MNILIKFKGQNLNPQHTKRNPKEQIYRGTMIDYEVLVENIDQKNLMMLLVKMK